MINNQADINIGDVIYWKLDDCNIISDRIIEIYDDYVKVSPSNLLVRKGLFSKNREDFVTVDDLVLGLARGGKLAT